MKKGHLVEYIPQDSTTLVVVLILAIVIIFMIMSGGWPFGRTVTVVEDPGETVIQREIVRVPAEDSGITGPAVIGDENYSRVSIAQDKIYILSPVQWAL